MPFTPTSQPQRTHNIVIPSFQSTPTELDGLQGGKIYPSITSFTHSILSRTVVEVKQKEQLPNLMFLRFMRSSASHSTPFDTMNHERTPPKIARQFARNADDEDLQRRKIVQLKLPCKITKTIFSDLNRFQ